MCLQSAFAEQATNDAFIVAAGQWADLDVLKIDKAVSNRAGAGSGTIELASLTKTAKLSVAGGLIRCLPQAGSVGADSFSYTYVAQNGVRSTATVTLNITAGSCSANMCGMNRAAGDCDAATGRCNCPAGSGLEAGFVPNPSVAARNITPEVSKSLPHMFFHI